MASHLRTLQNKTQVGEFFEKYSRKKTFLPSVAMLLMLINSLVLFLNQKSPPKANVKNTKQFKTSSLGRRPAFVRERVKGFRSAASRGEDGPPLCPPSVQRSWGSGVSGERLCGLLGLLWLGCPAVLSHPRILFSSFLPLLPHPTKHFG